MKEKKLYDPTTLYYIKVLKNLNIINTYEEGASIYYKLTNENLLPNELRRELNKTQFENINENEFLMLLKKTNEFIKKEIKEDIPTEVKVIKPNDIKESNYSFIPEEDFPLFEITSSDSEEIMIKKIKTKLSDELFYLEYFGFDKNRYEVAGFETGSWNTSMKLKKLDGTDKVIMVLNETFKAKVKKRKTVTDYLSPKDIENYIEAGSETIRNNPDINFNDQLNHFKNDPRLNDDLVIAAPGFEVHLGALQSKEAADFNYSSEHAAYRIMAATNELINYQKFCKAGMLVVGVGNDFLNSDTIDGKTPAGTEMTNDSRHALMAVKAQQLYIGFINTMKDHFNKVHVMLQPGNHDEQSSLYLFFTLRTYYKDRPGCENVEIELGFKDIRFLTRYVFGDTLIAMVHGKTSASKPLSVKKIEPMIINSFPEEYQKAKQVMVLKGHDHVDDEYHIARDNKASKTIVLTTPSLGEQNDWSLESGFANGRVGYTYYLASATRGYLGKHFYTPTLEERKLTAGKINKETEKDIDTELSKSFNFNNDSLYKKRLETKIKNLEVAKKELKLARIKEAKEIFNYLNVDYTNEDLETFLDKFQLNEKYEEVVKEKEMNENFLKVLTKKKGK